MQGYIIIFGFKTFQFSKHYFDVVAFTVDQACRDTSELCDLPLIPFDEIEKYYSLRTR